MSELDLIVRETLVGGRVPSSVVRRCAQKLLKIYEMATNYREASIDPKIILDSLAVDLKHEFKIKD